MYNFYTFTFPKAKPLLSVLYKSSPFVNVITTYLDNFTGTCLDFLKQVSRAQVLRQKVIYAGDWSATQCLKNRNKIMLYKADRIQ